MAQMGWIPEEGDRVVMLDKSGASITELADIEGLGVRLADDRWSVDVQIDDTKEQATEITVEYRNGHWEEVEL